MGPDLMWAAGFYEGEGSVSVATTLTLTVSQVNPEPLYRFAAVAGCGYVRFSRNETISVFRCYGLAAQRLAMRLYPHLSRRRRDQILRAVLAYLLRRVREHDRCQRGHRYAEVGVYLDPSGGRECRLCRADRRHGRPQVPRRLRTALEARVGVREYAVAS